MRDPARRTFLKSLAMAPLLPAVAIQTAPNPPPPSPSPAALPAASPSPNTPSAFARALAEAARERHGAHLDAAELAEVTQAIHGALQAAERLRAVRLGNADEPVTTFAARPPRADATASPARARGGRRRIRGRS